MSVLLNSFSFASQKATYDEGCNYPQMGIFMEGCDEAREVLALVVKDKMGKLDTEVAEHIAQALDDAKLGVKEASANHLEKISASPR